MRVFLFLIVAAKNSKKRRAAWSPAAAMTRGTTTPSRDATIRVGASTTTTAWPAGSRNITSFMLH